MKLYGVHPDEILAYWPVIQPVLMKPFVRMEIIKDYDTDYVLEKVRQGKMQCWLAHEEDRVLAVFITQVHAFQKRKVLSIPYVGAEKGTIDLWIEAIETFKDFARANDCSVVRGWGRKGWERVLQPDSVRIEFDIEV